MKKIIFVSLLTLICANNSYADNHEMKHDGKMKEKHHARMFNEMDSDKNSEVSKEEWNNFHGKKFDEIDANKDGKINKEECDSFHEKMKEKFKERKMNKKQ